MNLKCFSILLVVATMTLIELALVNHRKPFSYRISSFLYQSDIRAQSPETLTLTGPQCSNLNLMSGMTEGQWVPSQFTERQKRNQEDFLELSWKIFNIPRLLQRNDSLCGNVSFHTTPYHRALCDPYGSLPCCYRGRCTQRSVDNCVCKDCYDVRQTIHAELAEWIPTDPATRIYYFQGHNDSCKNLKNMTIHILGDSYLRHTYVSMLSLLNSDKAYGPLKQDAKLEEIQLCQNLTLYTPKCKYTIERGVARPCKNTVEIKYFEYWFTKQLNETRAVVEQLSKRPNSWLIVGIGVHENYDSNKVISKFLKPLLDSRRKLGSTWPKIIWSAAHAPGVLKGTKFPKQQRNGTLEYNAKLQKVLDNANITTFNSFQLTDNVVSFGGTHYGKGVNDVKAQILLNYLACQNTYSGVHIR